MLETRGLTDGKAFQYMAYYRTALGALPNLLAALALFYLFKGLDLGCVRWVNALAGTTLGVYILHQVPAFRGFYGTACCRQRRTMGRWGIRCLRFWPCSSAVRRWTPCARRL